MGNPTHDLHMSLAVYFWKRCVTLLR